MKRFTLDAVCFASIVIRAQDEDAARKIAEEALLTMNVLSETLEGLERLCVVYSAEDNIDLVDEDEIDEEAATKREDGS